MIKINFVLIFIFTISAYMISGCKLSDKDTEKKNSMMNWTLKNVSKDSAKNKIKKLTSYTIMCPEEKLKVTSMGKDRQKVAGCGKEAIHVQRRDGGWYIEKITAKPKL